MSGTNPRNEDLITGEPGSHPVGTGVGAAGGVVTVATIGTAIGGPIGTIVGAVIGAIAGGLAGKAIAEELDPTEGGTVRSAVGGVAGASARNMLKSPANARAGDTYWSSRLSWDQARNATKDAWNRVSG